MDTQAEPTPDDRGENTERQGVPPANFHQIGAVIGANLNSVAAADNQTAAPQLAPEAAAILPGQPAEEVSANNVLSTQPEEWTEFDRLITQAIELGDHDHRGAQLLTNVAVAAGLSKSKMVLLREAIGESTGFSSDAVKAFVHDALHRVDGRAIHSVDDLVKAEKARLRSAYTAVAAAEGCVYVYGGDAQPGVWRAMDDKAIVEGLIERYGRLSFLGSDRAQNQVCKRLQIAFKVPDDFFKSPKPGVAMNNGFLGVDPVTGEIWFGDHSPDHRARFGVRVDYDPEAQCPDYLVALLNLTGQDEIKATAVAEFQAATLFGVMPAEDNARTVLLFVGPSGAGKSAFASMVAMPFPASVVASVAPEKWSDGAFLVTLQGKRLNVVAELDVSGKAISGANLKLVASREEITARAIRRNPVTFTSIANHVFCANGLPRIGEKTASIARRIMAVQVAPMAAGVRINPNFAADLWAREAPGIINLLAEQVSAFVKARKFTRPADSDLLVTRMQYQNEPHEVVATVWLDKAPGERLWSSELQAALRVEAAAEGFSTSGWKPNTSMKSLAARLRELHSVVSDQSGGRPFYVGVRFAEGFAEMLRASGGADPADLGEDDSFAGL